MGWAAKTPASLTATRLCSDQVHKAEADRSAVRAGSGLSHRRNLRLQGRAHRPRNSPISGVGILSIVLCASTLILAVSPTPETRPALVGFACPSGKLDREL